MNDNVPTFNPDKYYFTIMDDFPLGSPIYQFKAQDADVSVKTYKMSLKLIKYISFK